MALYYQAVKAQVHRLLAKRSNELSPTPDMAGVTNHRQLGDATMQLNGNLPHRRIAVYLVVERRETTMDGSQTLDASLIKALHSTNPQFEVRVDRVLHEYGHVDTLQGIGQSLHGKGISRGTGTYP